MANFEVKRFNFGVGRILREYSNYLLKIILGIMSKVVLCSISIMINYCICMDTAKLV